MLEHTEKREYIRTNVNCNINYKLADSEVSKTGTCISLSGIGVSFIADCHYDSGLAMELNVLPENAVLAPMTSFIEVIRSTQLSQGQFEIAAVIKSLK